MAVKKRHRLEGNGRFSWGRGARPPLYGLRFLSEVRGSGRVLLVEGETDCWTLWYHRIPVLGISGASNWRSEYAALLDGLEVYLWHEPDGAGDGLVKSVAQDLPAIRLITPPEGAKDPSELYLQVGNDFKQSVEGLLRAARPISELQAEAFSEEARECLTAARVLLGNPYLLSELS